MKKFMKRMSAIFAGVLLLGTLTACSQFDAGGYVKAILDNSYYNDATGIIEQEVGTVEEAVAIYEQGIEAQVSAMLGKVAVSEELASEYRNFYKDLFSNVKYTVGETTEVDDETFEVAVTYEKMNIFTEAVAVYEAKVAEQLEVWISAAEAGEEVPTDEQMNEQLYTILKDCMVAELADAVYDAPETLMIRVELIDNVWTPNQEDLLNLEYSLFDIEGLYNTIE